MCQYQCRAKLMACLLHIVTYDIRDNRRWRRLFQLLKRRGAHRQLSVFLVHADDKSIRKLAEQIGRIIDPAVDAVLIAPINRLQGDKIIELGQSGPLPGPQVLIV
jgi:CRISPR-associated endonuclease Cas2